MGVHLRAIQELVEEFVNGSSFTQLWQLLSTLPKELEDLYSRILQKRKPEYRDEFYLMCLVMLKSHSLLSLESLLLVVDVDLNGQSSSLSPESMVRRLSSRSGGLIEAVSDQDDDTIQATDIVQFIHKTFKDFIRVPENITIVDSQGTNDSNFIGCKSLLTASIYVLKNLSVSRNHNHAQICRYTFLYAAEIDRHSLRSAIIPILNGLLEARGSNVSEPGVVGLRLWIEYFGEDCHSIRMKGPSQKIHPRSLQYDLATIAANYGCLYYVQRMVHGGLQVECLKRCPLLWSIVYSFAQPAFGKRLWETKYYISMLGFLVDSGAKVSCTWLPGGGRQSVGSTALELLLQSARLVITSSDKKLQMMNWLLKNGANPNRQMETKKDVHGNALWYVTDKEIWDFRLWKLLLKHGADPALKGGHDHRLLYFAILKGKSKIAKLLCRFGADPTKLGQGINALKLEKCTLDQFTYNENDMRIFVGNANCMQRMLQEFDNEAESSPTVPTKVDAREAVSHGTEHSRSSKNLSDDSDQDDSDQDEDGNQVGEDNGHEGEDEDENDDQDEDRDEDDDGVEYEYEDWDESFDPSLQSELESSESDDEETSDSSSS
ncbi:hypothetical protein V493_03984 [Pseudogymnoascus sp. VKM F-4281 (FW-2241)]|nr:hypothetical protein V493_03984 [Pseudogymnoascus sp. VKM F-4281 (FW-2241)]